MMTILNGRFVGAQEREFVLHTGGEEPAGGKIYPVDPAVVARFKAMLAAQEKAKSEQQLKRAIKRGGIKRNNAGVDNDLAERVEKLRAIAAARRAAETMPEAKKEQEMPAPRKLNDDEIVAAHRRYVLENLSVGKLVESLTIGETPLVRQFERLGLPVRGHDRRFRLGAVEIICKAHNLQPEDIPERARPFGPVAKAAKPVEPPAAVDPKPEPVQTAVVGKLPEPIVETAVVTPTNGTQPAANLDNDLAAITGQLEALQSLMAEAKAKSIEVSGWIRMEISAEVTF